jgi:hypothetical protein
MRTWRILWESVVALGPNTLRSFLVMVGVRAVSVFYLASLSHWNDRDASPAVTAQHKQGERHGRLL